MSKEKAMTLAVKTVDEIPTTHQELVDLVFTRLNQQKTFAYINGSCQYRNPDGKTCCAIGFLMPDDVADFLYDNVYTDCTITTLLSNIEGPINRNEFTDLVDWFRRLKTFEWEFLDDIQSIHDQTAMAKPGGRERRFFTDMLAFARQWDVDMSKHLDLDWSWIETYDMKES